MLLTEKDKSCISMAVAQSANKRSVYRKKECLIVRQRLMSLCKEFNNIYTGAWLLNSGETQVRS